MFGAGGRRARRSRIPQDAVRQAGTLSVLSRSWALSVVPALSVQRGAPVACALRPCRGSTASVCAYHVGGRCGAWVGDDAGDGRAGCGVCCCLLLSLYCRYVWQELYIAYIERMRSEMQPREDGARASRRAFCRVPRLGDCRPRVEPLPSTTNSLRLCVLPHPSHPRRLLPLHRRVSLIQT